MTFRDTSADITLDNANMATKEQLARLNADNPTTIVERLSGNYIYPGAISPMRTPPIEQEAGREIVRLRTEIDALKAKNAGLQEMFDLYNGTLDIRNRNIAEIIEVNKGLQAEIARLKADAERYKKLWEGAA
jgi:hypothetical protein